MISEFKKELKTLLEKYNASLSFACSSCSDLSGVHEEGIEVVLGDNETHKLTEYNWYIEACDL